MYWEHFFPNDHKVSSLSSSSSSRLSKKKKKKKKKVVAVVVVFSNVGAFDGWATWSSSSSKSNHRAWRQISLKKQHF